MPVIGRNLTRAEETKKVVGIGEVRTCPGATDPSKAATKRPQRTSCHMSLPPSPAQQDNGSTEADFGLCVGCETQATLSENMENQNKTHNKEKAPKGSLKR